MLLEGREWKQYGFKGVWLGDYPKIQCFQEPDEYCVYVVLDSYYKVDLNLNIWHFDYLPKYIGKGRWRMGSYGKYNRPFNHKNDLYSDNIIKNWDRYILTFPSYNLSEKAAYELESILIDAALDVGFTLSPKGLRNSETSVFQLWNKVKGHTLHGSYFRCTT